MGPLITKRALLATSAAFAASTRLAFADDHGESSFVEMSMGNPDADVTVIEYASLTCPHCASFHTRTWPDLKANYVDTGKINFIFREVYFDRAGLWAAAVARCGGPVRYFGIIDILFKEQADWSRKESPQEMVGALYAIGRRAGMTDDELNTCLQNRAMLEEMVEVYKTTTEADGITSTPSFVINGEKTGNMNYTDFSTRLDALLS